MVHFFNVFIYISPRSVIINLAKSLSSKLQKLMSANNLKIDNVLSEQKNNSAGHKFLLKVKIENKNWFFLLFQPSNSLRWGYWLWNLRKEALRINFQRLEEKY